MNPRATNPFALASGKRFWLIAVVAAVIYLTPALGLGVAFGLVAFGVVRLAVVLPWMVAAGIALFGLSLAPVLARKAMSWRLSDGDASLEGRRTFVLVAWLMLQYAAMFAGMAWMLAWVATPGRHLLLGNAGLMAGVGVGGFAGMRYHALIPRRTPAPRLFGLSYATLAWISLGVGLVLGGATLAAQLADPLP